MPPTPTHTPRDKMMGYNVRNTVPGLGYDSYSLGYDASLEETIKPTRKRSLGGPSTFEEMRLQAEQQQLMPSTPSSNHFLHSDSFSSPQQQFIPGTPSSSNFLPSDVASSPHKHTSPFVNNVEFNEDDFLQFDNSYSSTHGASHSLDRPMSSQGIALRPASSHHDSTPSTPHRARFPVAGSMDTRRSNVVSAVYPNMPLSLAPLAPAPLAPSPLTYDVERPESRDGFESKGHRRTDSLASLASMQSAASIADLNIDEARCDTGVQFEEIMQYVDGPDLIDGRWTCIFNACMKKFGRKENIKSHIQTHLNDRQYQCPSCGKCFVRQHDLKRHAKIHTGVKPYPCECGNSFARHDALTRHKQRGMCIGAFDGAVRKVGKRGRPRKNRPSSTVL